MTFVQNKPADNLLPSHQKQIFWWQERKGKNNMVYWLLLNLHTHLPLSSQRCDNWCIIDYGKTTTAIDKNKSGREKYEWITCNLVSDRLFIQWNPGDISLHI